MHKSLSVWVALGLGLAGLSACSKQEAPAQPVAAAAPQAAPVAAIAALLQAQDRPGTDDDLARV